MERASRGIPKGSFKGEIEEIRFFTLDSSFDIYPRSGDNNSELRIPNYYFMGTSKNRFEKGKWVECAECDESRRSKAVCLTRRFEEAVGVLYTFSLKQGF